MLLFNQATAVTMAFSGGAQNTIAAGGLAGAEKVEVLIHNGQGYVPFIDHASGDPVVLTADKPHMVFEGVGLFQAKKDATAGSVSFVYY
ncbi:hypothetical protein DLP3_007 [Stenotrophomonas phage vB_SmaS_DLP_3]|nr:hypothetical protein DLP3_007 [Stenotrophomonas phage vB_SmaS_DLP_3]